MKKLPKHLKEINNKIQENGYSLKDVSAVLQDKDAVLILLTFILRAIFYYYLSNLNKKDEITTKKFFEKRYTSAHRVQCFRLCIDDFDVCANDGYYFLLPSLAW